MIAEADFLNPSSPYRLRDTGQGLNRVQAAPGVARAMNRVLHECQSTCGAWVGSSVVHLGDHNVPNAFVFLDKYTQVGERRRRGGGAQGLPTACTHSAFLTPLGVAHPCAHRACHRDDPGAPRQDSRAAGVRPRRLWQRARARDAHPRRLLSPRLWCEGRRLSRPPASSPSLTPPPSPPDGSGADNFMDAGSCIDGRLTSAWEWASKIDKKIYAPVFKLCSVLGFDGRFER